MLHTKFRGNRPAGSGEEDFFFFFFFFFLIQFNVPFKIISLIETSQSIGGRNGRTPGKPPDTPASRTWLVSHVASAGLEPTPDTAVRKKIF